ncbi:MAG: TrmB family transcriptional regulator [Fusobacteriaceae bacterium]
MDNRDIIINNLQKIGLTPKESEIYYELVKNPMTNGSQIAKKLGYPRTSVYDTLSKLQNKGYILSFQEGEITSYTAVNPKDFLNRVKSEIEAATDLLDVELTNIDTNSVETQFYNLNSEVGIRERITKILSSSEKEVYINTNLDLLEFKHIFEKLKKRGVRVILFSFENTNYENLGIECYYRKSLKKEISSKIMRIQIVSDMKKAVIASNYSGKFTGTYSENNLLVNIVAEHIHNDIYILKLEKNFSGDFWQDINLHTMQEIPIN